MYQRQVHKGVKSEGAGNKAVSPSKFFDNFRPDFNLNVERGDVNAKVFYLKIAPKQITNKWNEQTAAQIIPFEQ